MLFSALAYRRNLCLEKAWTLRSARARDGPERGSGGLCATTRPHFFGGVATLGFETVVLLVKPDSIVFGRKDYQQLKVIEKMVRDFDLDVEILSGEIVREPVNGDASDADSCPGLAMSSRNTYLTEKAQGNKVTESISVALKDVADGISHTHGHTHTRLWGRTWRRDGLGLLKGA